jgi:hypothetical protein
LANKLSGTAVNDCTVCAAANRFTYINNSCTRIIEISLATGTQEGGELPAKVFHILHSSEHQGKKRINKIIEHEISG